ncbi:MAG: acyclic terpene utilization AtuA family protein, partial [Pseudomonadota bacterium]
MMATRILVPSGVLGLGFSHDALERGIQHQPDAIAIDGGSTDSGPFYLGTGQSKYADAVCRAEWRDLLIARAKAKVPLIMGSCGTCGTDRQVDAMFTMTCALARELGQKIRIARLYSSQSPKRMASAFDAGYITPLVPAPPMDATAMQECSNIVALAGVEQMIAALQTGADVILAGRATDTAGIAALPIMRGEDVASAWHGAKIAECGAFCTDNPASGVVLLEVDDSGFTIVACGKDAQVSARSVSAHMLYENANPHILVEPGGRLQVEDAQYTERPDGSVRVTKARWQQDAQYCVKLEGARCVGYQTSLLAIVRDGRYCANIQAWLARLEAFLHDLIAPSAIDYML